LVFLLNRATNIGCNTCYVTVGYSTSDKGATSYFTSICAREQIGVDKARLSVEQATCCSNLTKSTDDDNYPGYKLTFCLWYVKFKCRRAVPSPMLTEEIIPGRYNSLSTAKLLPPIRTYFTRMPLDYYNSTHIIVGSPCCR